MHAETQNDLARGGTELVRLRARARDQPVLEPGSWKRERERYPQPLAHFTRRDLGSHS